MNVKPTSRRILTRLINTVLTKTHNSENQAKLIIREEKGERREREIYLVKKIKKYIYYIEENTPKHPLFIGLSASFFQLDVA